MIDCAAGQDVNNNRDGDDVGQHVCLCGIHWRRHWFKSGSMDQTRGLGQCTERSALIMECRIKIATNNAFWPLSCLPAPAWSRPLPHQLIVEDGGDKVPLWPDCCRPVASVRLFTCHDDGRCSGRSTYGMSRSSGCTSFDWNRFMVVMIRWLGFIQAAGADRMVLVR